MTIFINDLRLDEYVDGVDESKFFHSTSPKRAYEEVTIPGRDGVLHLDQRRFEPYTLTIPVFFRKNFRDRYRRLLNVLNGLSGTVSLKCTPAPTLWGEGHYDAIFYGAIPAPDTGSWLHSGTVTLQFQCNPRWWLDLGNVPTDRMLFVTLQRTTPSVLYASPNFTYHTGDTLSINRLYVQGQGIGTCDIVFHYPTNKTTVNVGEIADAQTAWQTGTYYDLTQHLSDGDVFYLELDNSTWTINSDIPAGVEEQYVLAQTHKIYNDTPFKAQPLFELVATDDDYSDGATYLAQVSLNGIIIRVLRTYADAHSGRPLYIDCETQDCYYIDSNGESQNANAYVQMYSQTLSNPTTDFPALNPGENTFHESTGSTLYFFPMSTLRFYPRWYLI